MTNSNDHFRDDSVPLPILVLGLVAFAIVIYVIGHLIKPIIPPDAPAPAAAAAIAAQPATP